MRKPKKLHRMALALCDDQTETVGDDSMMQVGFLKRLARNPHVFLRGQKCLEGHLIKGALRAVLFTDCWPRPMEIGCSKVEWDTKQAVRE
jgi:hypothetical protein